MATTASFIYSKSAVDSPVVQADLTSLLQAGETITAITPQTVYPTTNPALAVSITSGVNPITLMMLSGGVNDVTYGYQLKVTTNARVFIVQVAVSVADVPFIPYNTQSPGAFQDLVGSIEAGKSAMSTAIFTFAPDFDASGGYVTWDLLSSDGTLFASGNAYSYDLINNGMAVIVQANSIVSVPSTVPPSMVDQRYQIRYTLQLPVSNSAQVNPLVATPKQNAFYSYESIEVLGYSTVPMGTQPQVETQGVPARLSIVTPKLYDNVSIQIFNGNAAMSPEVAVTEATRTANGFYYAATIDTTQFAPSLIAYTVVWKYYDNDDRYSVFQESADLWIINPSIMSAIMDVRAKINKAQTTLYGHPDMLFPNTVIMTWLRRAMDAFNAAYGVFTSFTMVNALGPIREFWLLYAEMYSLQAQALAEGEKAFQFQGQAISLDVDRYQYYEGMADKIQTRLDNEFKAIKTVMIHRGQTSGDGSQNPLQLRAGAIGAVGITITPATPWVRVMPLGGNR